VGTVKAYLFAIARNLYRDFLARQVRRNLSGPVWLLQLAMIMSGLAFARIVSDTSFDVSPRKFIVTAAIAPCFWVAFFVKLFRGRRSLMPHPR
jgi:hypothetical protein